MSANKRLTVIGSLSKKYGKDDRANANLAHMTEKESLRLLLKEFHADLPFSPESDGENGLQNSQDVISQIRLIVIVVPQALALRVRELIHLASIMDSTDSRRDFS